MHRLLFALEAERAHGLALGLLSFWSERGPLLEVPGRLLRVEDPRLRVEAFGVSFPNPLGLAAGMDKDARALGAWWALGFGFARWGPSPPGPRRETPGRGFSAFPRTTPSSTAWASTTGGPWRRRRG